MSPQNTAPIRASGRGFNTSTRSSLPLRPAGRGSSPSLTSTQPKHNLTTRTTLETPTKPSKKVIAPSKPHVNPPLSAPRASLVRRTPLKAPQKRNTNLPLPVELRDQILTHLLKMAGPRVEYLPPRVRRFQESCAKAHNRTLAPLSAHQTTLRGIYLSLILTSKAMKADATRILFYTNQWAVRISLIRDLLPKGCIRGRNGMTEVHRAFGEGVIGFVRDFSVMVVSEDKASGRSIKTYIGELVNVLRESRSLRKLTVEWRNYYIIPRRYGPARRKAARSTIRLFRRFENGRRRVRPHLEDWKVWEAEEMVLSPFAKLRNVPEAHVVGIVSDEWATYLEGIMMGPEGKVDGFVRVQTGSSKGYEASLPWSPLKYSLA